MKLFIIITEKIQGTHGIMGNVHKQSALASVDLPPSGPEWPPWPPHPVAASSATSPWGSPLGAPNWGDPFRSDTHGLKERCIVMPLCHIELITWVDAGYMYIDISYIYFSLYIIA